MAVNVSKVMDQFKRRYFLILIFLAVFSLRLFFAFQTSEFSDDNAYFVLRQVEHIKTTGFPFLIDDNTVDSTSVIFNPIFYYIIAIFSKMMPTFVAAKIIPNLLASITIYAVYLISYKLTRDVNSSLFASFVSGFIPIFFVETINSISVYSLVMPLVFFSFYCFMMIPTNDDYIYPFIILIGLLSFTHPLVIVVILGLIMYAILAKSENIKTKHIEIEVIIVSAFLVLWSQLLIYKDAFNSHGLGIIWQNIPHELSSLFFANINILDAIYLIGTIPVFFGVHTLYQYILEKKSRYMIFFLSYSLPIFFLLWLKIMTPKVGLIFLGLVLVVISAIYFKNYLQTINKSKFYKFKPLMVIAIVIVFTLSTVAPTIIKSWDKINAAPEQFELDAYTLLSKKESGAILAPYYLSHLIQYYSNQKTFIDSKFLLVSDVETLYSDYLGMYREIYTTDAIRSFDSYGIKYIVLTKYHKKYLGIDELIYTNDKNCFDLIYDKNDLEVYEIKCNLREGV